MLALSTFASERKGSLSLNVLFFMKHSLGISRVSELLTIVGAFDKLNDVLESFRFSTFLNAMRFCWRGFFVVFLVLVFVLRSSLSYISLNKSNLSKK